MVTSWKRIVGLTDYLLHQHVLQVHCLAQLQAVTKYKITTLVIASLETVSTAGAKVEDVSFISLKFGKQEPQMTIRRLSQDN